MASLATLPPELLNLITGPLTLPDLLKIRLLNKSHNLKFQHYFRSLLFTSISIRIDINSDPDEGDSIYKLSHLPSAAKSYIQTIIISGSKEYLNFKAVDNYKSNNNTSHNITKKSKSKSKSTSPNLSTILQTLPNLKTITIKETTPSTIITSLLTISIFISTSSSSTSLQSLHITTPSLNLTDLTFPASPIPILHSLTTLSLSLKFPFTNNHHLDQKPISKLWTWITSLSQTLHSLTLKNTSSPPNSLNQPWPLHPHQTIFLPKNKNKNKGKDDKKKVITNLPHLKSLKLHNIHLTIQDIHHLLPTPKDSLIEYISFEACQMQYPDKEWYEVISYLLPFNDNNNNNNNTTTANRQYFKHLNHISLKLNGHHPTIPTYELPDLEFTNLNRNTDINTLNPLPTCKISLNTTTPTNQDKKQEESIISLQKPLHHIITPHPKNNTNIKTPHKSFWTSLTNGKYTSPSILKWKRIRLLADQYDIELKKLSAYAQYDYHMADRLEKKFQRDLDRIEMEAAVAVAAEQEEVRLDGVI
ncbi:hypothetical protein AOL_s00076g232 [Orbilia oligospora ATCC 24927]|uniref:F-box domain-containing protein n=1 Tax=Arthrobotrys oligospora (strain ATCC 24927 / CBS 115.81 / DSM 1491) TaxID=756982 RepID=G1X9C5_ARTOA|nr:hypothetical protein AOL_s00076g232 [Orbilia oligospora ATCC 24927]EGX50267.1 hypothetical protein AOL_s00076g232 [Orbilia oligospora ATCC 24927]